MLKTLLDPHWKLGKPFVLPSPRRGMLLTSPPNATVERLTSDSERCCRSTARRSRRRICAIALRDCWWCSRLLSPPAPRGAAGMLRRRRRRWRRRRSQDSPVTQEQGISLNLSVLWVVCSNPPLRLLLECPHYQSSSLTPQVRNAIGASRPWRIPCKIAHSLQCKLCHSSSR